MHWLGTDHFGRDMLSLIMVGARNSIAVALVAVGIGWRVGVPLGLMAAARGGPVDEAVMRLSDFVFAFPAMLIAILITAMFGPGAINAIIAIGIFNIPVFARVAARRRAERCWPAISSPPRALAGKGTTAASRSSTCCPTSSASSSCRRTIQFALGILAEAGLSYVGLGTQPPTRAWGRC